MAGDLSAGASILTGFNPLTDNLSLFLVQLLIIICLSRLIGAGLAYLHQPRVIAEVIVGILLGPSALSRIPAFANNVFPASSKPLLKLVADFGLVLFLFLVGLEIDPRSLLKSAKIATSISLAGIAVPFALGVGVSKLIYELIEIPDVLEAGKAAPPFLSFTLFIGCAMSITAFPVLARMLTERKLLGTKVGQATMAAAAVDDVMAWILLILVVALINNPANSIVAVYVFLLVVAWFIFLWFAVRPVIVRIVKYNNPDPNSHEISPFTIFAMFFVVIVSATFAQILGIHAIFGAFLAGIIMPHEDGFAAKITEKIEDLVSVLFLPLYFTYSGLNTRIDQLSDGLTWAMVVLVIATAMVGKIFGCMLASKITGLTWRESWTVGFLMSTKGLVELIVLNLGLSAGVISVRVFTICVVMALVTTFVTMPVVTFIYP
ncbi:Cation/H+ exchanger, partial [Cladochytrium replicatum]